VIIRTPPWFVTWIDPCPQGNGFADDVCVECTGHGNCPAGFYYDATDCDAGTATADSCVACAASALDCPAGTFFYAGGCTGKGRSDNACQSCCPGALACPSVFQHRRCRIRGRSRRLRHCRCNSRVGNELSVRI
jgi:hypothetical protein